MVATILIADDDAVQRRLVENMVQRCGYAAVTVDSGDAVMAHLTDPDAPAVDALVLDLVMPGLDGMGVLAKIRDAGLDVPVIVQTAHGGIDNVISAMRAGATDFVVKPASPERLQVSLKNALMQGALAGELQRMKRSQSGTLTFSDIVTRSPAMTAVLRNAEKAAASSIPVLIQGESGVGKELIARAIHGSSDRKAKAFVAVNCGAIPDNLVESILFGHEKGAFTGAQTKRRGLFEQAHGGTLFLDEIGDMDIVAQAKVLRALQSGEISRVGSEHVINVDVRVLAATNKDVGKEVETGKFREDLFFRLNVFPLRSPNLRERVEDIPLLADAFMQGFAKENGTKPKPIDAAVVTALVARKWPGNVRELKNVVERMAILSGDRVTIADLPEDPHESPFGEEETAHEPTGEVFEEDRREEEREEAIASRPPTPGQYLTLREYRDQTERKYIVDTLKLTGWNISRTAVVLGVERTNLHKKIRGYQIKRGEG